LRAFFLTNSRQFENGTEQSDRRTSEDDGGPGCYDYHRERNNQRLDNRLIAGTPATDMASRVRRRSRLGGLLNFYARAA